MDLKPKWYEFLLAGGLFWLPQLYFISRLFPSIFSYFEGLETFFTSLSEPLPTLISTTVIAAATLLFLVTGNILDMLGLASGLPIEEMHVFYRHLTINKEWVEKALPKYSFYIQDSYDNLANKFKPIKQNFIQFLRSQVRRLFIADGSGKNQKLAKLTASDGPTEEALVAFDRLYMLILVRALSKYGNEPPDLLTGPLETWRLSTLLLSTFSYVALELVAVILLFPVFAWLLLGQPLLYEAIDLRYQLPVYIIFLGITYLISRLTYRGFDRVCLVLFSLWYDFESSADEQDQSQEQTKNERSRRKIKSVGQARTKPNKNSGRRA